MQIRRLHISTAGKELVDISFSLHNALALVGESGSGKSLTLKALLGMLPEALTCRLDVEAPFELVRGESVAFVPQNPFTALSPLTRIEDQFFQPRERITQLLETVGLDAELMRRFPPELSGGQLQRVVIAMALGCRPRLLLLDEPTTALDPQTRALMIALLNDLRREIGFAMLFVTHDIHSATQLCDEICVIRSGKVVETGTMASVVADPRSPYTRALIEANFARREYRQ